MEIVNGVPIGPLATILDVTELATGYSVAGGVIPKTLTVDEDVTISDKANLVSPSFTTPNLGTPSACVATNLSGTAANLTAGTVTTNASLTGEVTSVGNAATVDNAAVIAKVLTGYTAGAGVVEATDTILAAIQKLDGNDATNANLTGVITSVGNETSIASQTGTGTTFVTDTSPTLITPMLGVAACNSLNGLIFTPLVEGFSIAGGTASKTLTVEEISYIDQNLTRTAIPLFENIKLAGLTDGYIPVHYGDLFGMTDSPIYVSPTTGYVGINTDTPTSRLTIDGNVAFKYATSVTFSTENATAGGVGTTLMIRGGYTSGANEGGNLVLAGGNSAAGLGGSIYLDSGTGLSPDTSHIYLNTRVGFGADGNVSIGWEDLPAERLHVKGNIRQTTLAGANNRLLSANADGNIQSITTTTNFLSFNTGVLPAASSGTVLSVSNADNNVTALEIDCFSGTAGNTPRISFRRSAGTAGTPTAVSTGYMLGNIIFVGRKATGYSAAQSAIRCYAAENWTDSVCGTYITFLNTPTGSSTPGEVLRINPDGKLGVLTTTPSYSLSFGGYAPRVVGLERHTAGNTAGNPLTVIAGGCTLAATDKAGGQLFLMPGLSTGTGESGITIQGNVAGGSGTSDNSYQDMIKVLGNKLGFYNATPVVKASHIANATDTTDVITRVNAILVVLENLGLVAAS